MNNFTVIDVSYLRPLRTIETILLKKGSNQRILYVYNFEGIHFAVFSFIVDILNFFNNQFDPEIFFESESDLDNYLLNLELAKIDLSD